LVDIFARVEREHRCEAEVGSAVVSAIGSRVAYIEKSRKFFSIFRCTDLCQNVIIAKSAGNTASQ
jgi:hypothetical protein